ncbi:5-methyltetrahydropteroyltriglutamate-homoc ysteine s-methyltransferase isoform A [Micractinium conductrix]|uniref:5-methyltetrahydropteroyltriglutamate--homocysteine S-methyltransferase n=1 Tax=Micractinium conductrix TaxID=554055 RepID=A0A2P6VPX4_9CHLO|nr:5-methyltetrahydropteroyltriglutamate-homoc ysteine s-methyltransferase isoform A [Micractinium conductrix]|eukprot:PSC76117.1 5-methyltetrahydropteroyltriglutamate-homoc ysteine s-methyltransferase isoform A [Micractinium conductrix]
MMSTSTIGFPRTGPKREAKKALEAYWAAGAANGPQLLAAAADIEAAAWRRQAEAGVELTGLDGTLYDQMLDAVFQLGLLPPRFQALKASAEPSPADGPYAGGGGLDLYFKLARGAEGAPALDMSKYMDTNYHIIVPELCHDTAPCADWSPLLDRVRRGQDAVGVASAVPIVVGPCTLVGLARGEFDRSEMVARLAPAYAQLLRDLAALGVPEVQFHEPFLTKSSAEGLAADCAACYGQLAAAGVPINLVVPYDDVAEGTYRWLIELPVAAISLDFCGVPGADYGCRTAQLIAKYSFPKDKRLGAGVIDGRGCWADASGRALRLLRALRATLGADQAICVQTSTSLQHLPYDLASEPELPSGLPAPLAFAVQKVEEVVTVARAASAATDGAAPAEPHIDLSTYTGAPPPAECQLDEALFRRAEPYEGRRPKQVALPPFPTTTIGSFPQTPAIRRHRLAFKQGRLSLDAYRERMAAEIGFAIGAQEALGLDVLVHGEPERTDMVEYFGQQLSGFHFTQHGWVQSYGSRYTRPPIIVGDITRTGPMTVHEYEVAQGLTSKPVKGMLTGPVTILQWSFARNDVPRAEQAAQLALALRDEVKDLAAAGCRVLQVDEPALREGLPLKADRQPAYLRWAVDAFRLATAAAPPEVQVVTHLCYSDFDDIMPAIHAMDADVLTIENSRSGDEMIHALAASGYTRDVGPGVYDVHSPLVPSVEWLADKLRSYLQAGLLGGDASRIHVNPDCGLKTRRWEEVLPSLRNMVAAAQQLRAELVGPGRPPATPRKPASPVESRSAGGVASACPCCAL